MPAVLCVYFVRMPRLWCTSCPSSTGGRTYQYNFSAEMPPIDMSVALAPGAAPHRASFNMLSVLNSLPRSVEDGCGCPTVTEVKMRCRFIHLPDNLDPPMYAKAYFIDQNQYKSPGGMNYPPCVVGVASVLSQSSTDMTQPFNTVFTGFHRLHSSSTPDFTVTVYFTATNNTTFPISPTVARFIFDFEVCYEEIAQCAESAPDPASYEGLGVEGMVE